MITQKDIDKFWTQISFPVDLNECWNWSGYCRKNNFGVFTLTNNSKQYSVKTFSYIIHNDFTEVEGRNIIQICDNIKCVNPTHLKYHNMSLTREHKFYEDMVSRVLRPNHKYYKDYGGRGIDLDPRYNPDLFKLKGVAFLNLYIDLSDLNIFPIPDGYSIDRIDNNKGYWKNNLRLATPEEQSQNTRRNILTNEKITEIRTLSETIPISVIAKNYNCSTEYIRKIVNKVFWKNI